MAELVAVNDIFSLIDFASFKRQALMFDRIAFPHLRKAVDRLLAEHHDAVRPMVDQLDWLQTEGILFEPELNVSKDELAKNEEFKNFDDIYWDHAAELDTFHGVTMDDVVKTGGSNESVITAEGQRAWKTLIAP
jgi:hypothetical protein